MPTVPLHPALVHLPLVLAMLGPIVVGAALWRVFQGNLDRTRRVGVVVAYGLLVVGGLLSLKTGEGDEDRVEKVVGERQIEEHEEAAQFFVGGGVVVVLLSLGFAFVRTAGASRAVGVAVAVASLIVVALALHTGKLGGEIVYVHGGGAAWSQGSGGAPTEGPAGAPKAKDKDDDDDDD